MSTLARPGVGVRIGRVFAILGIFVLVGPPVGALVFMLSIAIIAMGRDVDLGGLSWIGLFALIYGIPFGYLIGVWPAATAGLLVGVRQAFFGPMHWWLAFVTGLLVGVGFQLATGQAVLPAGDDTAPAREQGPVMIATCTAATLVCWAIVRTRHFAAAKVEP